MVMTHEPTAPAASPEGGLAHLRGDEVYVVADVDRSAPFLMSIVSDGDRWMFASSTGALTAGRRDASGALFPYETDDRLHAAAGRVGAVTRLRLGPTPTGTGPAGDDPELAPWVPFDDRTPPTGPRWVAKSVVGDVVTFGERHGATGLEFVSQWASSQEHGFIRSAELTNDGTAPVTVDLIDGLVGVMPHGIDPTVHQRYSNLTNAYKRAEVIGGPARLAVVSLEAPVSDLAEPEEVLRATVVWSTGLPGAEVSLDPAALRAFDDQLPHPTAPLVTGRPGAYLLRRSVELEPGQTVSWRIVADVGLDQVEVSELRRHLAGERGLDAEIDAAVARTRDRLVALMSAADAQQHTADSVACAHHVANVTYNVMRGGLPLGGHVVDTDELRRFVETRDRRVLERHAAWFDSLPPHQERRTLLARAVELGDPHLERLVRDDLPFSFSRRHGDPSRPWNAFSIRVQDDQGQPIVHFEGNWRDVFQNWEALCESFPEFLPGVVSTFVNASTPDGHNPYRITRAGIDWEVPDPDDPWANIGYWGDHQVVYLLRLLRAADRMLPGEIAELLGRRAFTYAEVPYRIVDIDQMLRDPKNTIIFDVEADARIREQMAEVGGDGALVRGPDGLPLLVTLLEKLLVTSLAKLSNLVPGGGIWMNTQRPEWNDANNALVGYGLSMVTLFHLRQFMEHLRSIVAPGPVEISAEVVAWSDEVMTVLCDEPPAGAGAGDGDEAGRRRWTMLQRLGRAASGYRASVADGFSGATVTLSGERIVELCDAAIAHLDATIATNRRDDRLVHSYNLLELGDGTAGVRHLPEMLEGQVAALGTGILDASEQADLVEALFASRLHRADVDTFVLAPPVVLPSFLDRNVVPDEAAAPGTLLGALLDAGDRSVVRRDADGRIRFHPDLVDAHALDDALGRLGADERWSGLVAEQHDLVRHTYEAVFDHRGYLGRSGSMYAYEGIGSVYWHMVTKLLLAVQEAASDAADQGAEPAVVERLVAAYGRVRGGLGFNRSAEEFGAVPTDPYSHTPAHAGAQQPGMTGAVKEELLARRRELGVRVIDGDIEFDELLLRETELLDRPAGWTVRTASATTTVELDAGSLGLTVCQVPVVIGRGSDGPAVEVRTVDGTTVRRSGRRVGRDLARAVFARSGEVELIRAVLPAGPTSP